MPPVFHLEALKQQLLPVVQHGGRQRPLPCARLQHQLGKGIAAPTVAAFDAASLSIRQAAIKPSAAPRRELHKLSLDKSAVARLSRTKDGMRVDLQTNQPDLADWLMEQARPVLEKLRASDKRR